MPAFEIEEQTASVEVHINPLVNWVWFGFGILAIGTGIALLPEAGLAFAAAKLPAEAVTASMVLLSILLSSAPRSRSTGDRKDRGCSWCRAKAVRSSKLRAVRRLFETAVGQCSCGHCAPIRAEVDTMLKDGKSEGSEFLHTTWPSSAEPGPQ